MKAPLEGIRVIESTYVFAFPYAAGLLSDLGAEVIKIEGPGRPDTTRNGAFAGAYPDNIVGDDSWNRTASYNQINRGKKSLTLDLSKDEGREILVDMLKQSDIFMENFTPRVMKRWGLDYPNLKKIKPDIIMVSNTGYGHGEGPWSSYPAQATTQEATHGHCHITGYDKDIPSKAGQSFIDFLSCWSGLMGIANALRHRNKTGEGQWVDVGMYQLGAYLTSEYILDWMSNSFKGERIGNRHRWRSIQGVYRCSGPDEWISISIGTDLEWEKLCNALNAEELLNNDKYKTELSRRDNYQEIDKIIEKYTQSYDKHTLTTMLQNLNIPAGSVYDASDSNTNPHYWERGFLETVQFPEERKMGKRVLMGRPWKANKSDLKINRPAPTFGDSNHDFIVNLLGHSEEKYNALVETNITTTVPVNLRPTPTMSLDELVKAGRLKTFDPDFKKKLDIL